MFLWMMLVSLQASGGEREAAVSRYNREGWRQGAHHAGPAQL